MRPDVVILGEYNPDSETHRATDAAIRHSLVELNAELAARWISTATIKEADILQAHGLWVAPGSPYKNLSRALQAIRLARANLVPCLGTCGGFQHMIPEFARNVLGFADAKHAEYDPDASRLFISATESTPHPLVSGFLQAVLRRRTAECNNSSRRSFCLAQEAGK